jgi:hypothetical protein
LRAVPLVTSAMGRFPMDPALQHSACYLLSSLCQHRALKPLLIDAKIRSAVAAAMDAFPNPVAGAGNENNADDDDDAATIQEYGKAIFDLLAT